VVRFGGTERGHGCAVILVSASTNFGQGDVTTYGVQVGLSFAF
jgi:hypothetical protein